MGAYRVLLATVHRRENWGEPLQSIAQSFLQILDKFPDTALLLPLHRNPTVREPLQATVRESSPNFLDRTPRLWRNWWGQLAIASFAD